MKSWIRSLAALLLVVTVSGGLLAGSKDTDKGKARLAGPAPIPAVTLSTTAGTVIFTESFEGAAFPPANWSMRNADGNIPGGSDPDPSDTAWYQSASVGGTVGLPVFDGVAVAAAYYGTANGFLLDDWLITPNTGDSAPAQTVDSLVFYVSSRLSSSGNYPDSLDIRLSTTNTDPASFSRLRYMLAPKDRWERVALLLPQTTNRYIGFRYLLYDGGPNGSNSDKAVVDLVQVIRYSTTSVSPTGEGLPASFGLSQNYPNPFNPSTRIRFALPEAANATLSVYTILGEEVASLVNGMTPAGTYEATFDATGLPSGMYLCRLTAGSFTATRSMMLVR